MADDGTASLTFPYTGPPIHLWLSTGVPVGAVDGTVPIDELDVDFVDLD
jgi:hypothetical protein